MENVYLSQSIPYVIENQAHKMADVLNSILSMHPDSSLDIATAYFSVSGYRELRAGLGALSSFRLLLGFEPATGQDLGLKLDNRVLAAALRGDLERLPFNEQTMLLVEELVAFLRREETAVRLYEQGFLHAKSYLFFADKDRNALFDRFLPLIGIVGSSNFTGPGLRTNKELNLAHKTLIEVEETEDPLARVTAERLLGSKSTDIVSPSSRRLIKSEVGARAILDLASWYEGQWQDARDYKDELIELLDASKFGSREYTPYDVYLKAIYEYFRDDLSDESTNPDTRSAVELAEFQEDAVKKARKILAKYDGVIIGDSVGMGKTWIGKKLLEDYAYHQRMKALVVCPASLRIMWERELASASISAKIISQEMLGQSDGNFDPSEYADVDVLLIDESHNFRNRSAQRYQTLETIIHANRGKGRNGEHKKVILMTATPINNSIYDLYNQIVLITGNDRSYFAAAGIGDLKRYFDAARRQEDPNASTMALFNLLEEVVIRRTRQFIRKAYPNATIQGEPVRWPERQLRTLRYNLEQTYDGIYETIVAGVDQLTLAHYNLEHYKKKGVARDDFELGRGEALVGIFKSRYLKRFESSVDAFRITIRRALSYIQTYEDYLLGGKLLDSRSFEKATRFLSREDEDDDATPRSLSDDFDSNQEAQEFLSSLPVLNPSEYDLKALHRALRNDIEVLSSIWGLIRDITPDKDAKLIKLKELLGGELRGQKVLIFTYYKDTARYLYSQLGTDKGAEWRAAHGNPNIRRMDSGASPRERLGLIQAFSPVSNNKPELVGSDKEIDIMISTDVLSEGQNLQDCGIVVNYDLHWNPTRMVQRAGRIDRIGSSFDTISIYNMFPDAGLERLLKLVESLTTKIQAIDKTGFLDASVLGEIVNPRNFNTLRRINEEDNSVIEEQERFIELASPEFLQQELRNLLESGAKESLEALPDGIHSGLYREGSQGLFFYFTAPDHKTGGRQHYWRYYDATTGKIHDNRLLIAGLISCARDTPRIIGDLDVFAIQEKVIASILDSVQAQAAVEAAPTIVDPVQMTLVTVLQQHLDNPLVKRADVRAVMAALRRPATGHQIRGMKEAYNTLASDGQSIVELLEKLQGIVEVVEGGQPPASNAATSFAGALLGRDDLHLVCFDHVLS
jgi:SNF2 family DNA or RNA helicase